MQQRWVTCSGARKWAVLHAEGLQALPLGMAAQHLPAERNAVLGAGVLQGHGLQGCQQQLPSRQGSMLSLPGVQTQLLCCLCRRVRKDRARPVPPAEATRAAAAARAGARRGGPAAAAAEGSAEEAANGSK